MSESVDQREITRQSFLRESNYFRFSSPLTSVLDRACAEDNDMIDLGSATRQGQQAGQLLPCTAQYLLMRSPDEKLAKYFPSMTDTPMPTSEAFPAYREFCLDRRSELMELLSWRTMNTNLVEKASSLLPAIQFVARQSREPLTLLEICCSAGLNLIFDEYHYDYGAFGRVGKDDSPVQLNCKVIGKGRPPVEEIPHVARRIGVDLVKVDPSSPSDQLWMEAVLFPEWVTERKRLREALKIRTAYELETLIGDALHVIPPLLEKLPGSLCIWASYCMTHWTAEARADLDALLCRASRHRDIHRVGMEMPDDEAAQTARDRMMKLAAAGVPIIQKSFPSPIDYTLYRNGEATRRKLGQGDGFGAWVDWQVFD